MAEGGNGRRGVSRREIIDLNRKEIRHAFHFHLDARPREREMVILLAIPLETLQMEKGEGTERKTPHLAETAHN